MSNLAETLSAALSSVPPQQQAQPLPVNDPGAVPPSSFSANILPLLQLAACVLEAGCELAQQQHADLAPFIRLAEAVALSPASTALLPSLMPNSTAAPRSSCMPCWLPYDGAVGVESGGGGTGTPACSPGLLALWVLRAAVSLVAAGATQQQQQQQHSMAGALLPAVAPLLRLPQREGGAWALQLLLMTGVMLGDEEQHGGDNAGSKSVLARAVAVEACHFPELWRGVLPAASALLQQLVAPGCEGAGQEPREAIQPAAARRLSGSLSDRCCLGALRRRAPAAVAQLLHACATLQVAGGSGEGESEGEAAQAALLDPALAPGVVAAALRVLQGGREGANGSENRQLLAAALAVLGPLAPRLPRAQAMELLAGLAERVGAGDDAGAGAGSGAGQLAGGGSGSERAAPRWSAHADPILLCAAGCPDNPDLQQEDWQGLRLRRVGRCFL